MKINKPVDRVFTHITRFRPVNAKSQVNGVRLYAVPHWKVKAALSHWGVRESELPAPLRKDAPTSDMAKSLGYKAHQLVNYYVLTNARREIIFITIAEQIAPDRQTQRIAVLDAISHPRRENERATDLETFTTMLKQLHPGLELDLSKVSDSANLLDLNAADSNSSAPAIGRWPAGRSADVALSG